MPSGFPHVLLCHKQHTTSHHMPNGVATGVHDFLSASKVTALLEFWEAVGGGGEVVVGGASLEDAVTTKFAAVNLMLAPDGGDGNGCVWRTVLLTPRAL